MKRKIYMVEIEDIELENVEYEIRKKITNMIVKEITEHSKDIATNLLTGKPLKKKRWYHSAEESTKQLLEKRSK